MLHEIRHLRSQGKHGRKSVHAFYFFKTLHIFDVFPKEMVDRRRLNTKSKINKKWFPKVISFLKIRNDQMNYNSFAEKGKHRNGVLIVAQTARSWVHQRRRGNTVMLPVEVKAI